MVAPNESLLDRLLTPLAECLTEDSAQRLLRFELDADTRARVDLLASKANEGQLSDAERAEYLDFVEAVDLIAILQAKARKILERRGPRSAAPRSAC
ncbi:MAG: hypothetical protein ACREIT_10405 [Tepidisphaeraceae bacterium]